MKDTKLAGLSRENWLEIRKQGLGGSDIASIMKQSPWSTPLDVYYDKMGMSEPIPDNPRMKAGRFLEGAVADLFEDNHPEMKVRKDTRMRVHHKHNFLYANTDRLLQDEDGKLGVLEIKTTSSFYAKTWEESIPYQYYCQLQHYLNVMGYDYGYVAILIDGYDYADYYYERDDKLIAEIEAEAIKFWKQNVLKGVEPEPMSDEDLAKLFPTEEKGKEIEADMLDIINIEKYLDAQQRKGIATLDMDDAKFNLKKSMTDCEVLVDHQVVLATLKANAKGTRILRVNKQ
jgi:putative phage-type endonuclease